MVPATTFTATITAILVLAIAVVHSAVWGVWGLFGG
ncbi:MAG: hypothetical protein JWQ97_1582 [Phenylobacterium sp.]|nr:hypothetical protein [Phenylobacterium sp.]